MANGNFGKQDHSWRVQIGQLPHGQEQLFWGDEYNWNSLVPILWGTLDHPRFRVTPPKVNGDIFLRAAWWQAPLHALHFGLGWTDLAKGLDAWRREGYPVDNHVLRSVYNTYGPAIEGLEIWLKSSHDWKWSMEAALGEGRETLKSWDQSEVELQAFSFEKRIHTGPRHQLAEGFAPHWGSDNFHLSGHFPSIVREDPNMDADPAWLYEKLYASVVLESYRAWPREVLRGLELFYGQIQSISENFVVEVTIVGFGSLGRFAISPRTCGLFRRSIGQGTLERDAFWHIAGNKI